MTQPTSSFTTLDKRDLLLALAAGIFALAIYTLALAPDMLYSDSGEFQALTYTWGTTHPTGYPVYLLLARLIGLIPVSTLAWRVNFASAVGAAVALGGIYLVTRYFARRGAALLSCLVLMVSYTFWSQSIIAEVYTPAAAFITAVLLGLLGWSEQPAARRAWLFAGGFLLTLGLGVHLFLALIAPAALVFVLWTAFRQAQRWRHVLTFLLGLTAGGALFFLLFAFMDARPTPTSFFNTAMYPSRTAWGLSEADFDTPFERFWISLSGVQWRDRMNPPDLDYSLEFEIFAQGYLPREYTMPALLLAGLGMLLALAYRPRKALLLILALLTTFVVILGYSPGDKYIFYLPVYLLLAVFVGGGADRLAQFAERIPAPARLFRLAGGAVLLVLLWLCVGPFLASRWQAVQTGRSDFVTERFTYPVEDLALPRRVAECVIAHAPEPDAYLVLSWRALYAIYYVAHVERGWTQYTIREARPHGTNDITASLQADIADAVRSQRPVYTDSGGPAFQPYRLEPVGSCAEYSLYRVHVRG